MTAGRRARVGAPRPPWWRWGIPLGALAVALSPLVMLALRPDPPGPAPALAPGPLAEARDIAPEPAVLSAEATALSEPPGTQADAPRSPAGTAPCPRDSIPAGAYSRCLYDTIRASEQALEAAVANALGVISGRDDLAPAQRNRWKGQLDEAQSRFLLFRNFDCQSVAPFEGARGIGNFEARAHCLIVGNTRRADELAARYPRPPAASTAGGATGPRDQPGTWTHAVSPLLD
ncbi:lysozyme inhibitor LprI family protein [Xanthobacter sp. V4C-4]|uniref:lysozyme inhibitor LprI family protein n=1 Tax=Xanthobacter cornucopiae TaxID=3119924 RepID=UPI0037285AA7